jgi:hypothetical protein
MRQPTWKWLMTCTGCGKVHDYIRHNPSDIMSGGTWSNTECSTYRPHLNPNEVARLQMEMKAENEG